jgi:hypothetical protein
MSRAASLGIAVGIAVFGLVWRLASLGLPPFVHKYGGSVA